MRGGCTCPPAAFDDVQPLSQAAPSGAAAHAGRPQVPSVLPDTADLVRDPGGHVAIVLDDPPDEPESPGDPSSASAGVGDLVAEAGRSRGGEALDTGGPLAGTGGESPGGPAGGRRRTRSTFVGIAAANAAMRRHMSKCAAPASSLIY